jgi:hypothetical protein
MLFIRQQVPPTASKETERIVKRKLTEIDPGPKTVPKSTSSHTKQSRSILKGRPAPEVPITLGNFYPVDVLPDHKGPLFQQKKARLVQRDLRNTEGELIPPWEQYNELRPGALILVKANLVCWSMKDTETAPTKKVRVQ